jgi:predicted phage replisome organizer
MSDKKRYWLKLEKNFLQSRFIKIIKNMPNGNDYILFYLALMLESIETVGHLRFTELVPYNENMLSALTDTNVDIVRSAMKLFSELGMLTVLQDGTIFLPEVPKLTGNESESAERVRLFREKKRQEALQCNVDVTKCNDNKEKDIQEDIQQEEEYKNPPTPLEGGDGDVSTTSKPKKSQKQYITLSDAGLLIVSDHRISYELGVKLKLFAQNRREIKKPMTRLALEQTIDLLMTKLDTDQQRIDCIQLSIANGWQGVFPDRIRGNPFTANAKPRAAQRDKFASLEGYREL